MTSAEERAEKILVDLFYWRRAGGAPINDLKGALAAQIAEAEREAVLKKFEGEDSVVANLEHEAYLKGWTAAREKAAEEVRSFIFEGGLSVKNLDLAERIEKMEPGE